MYFPLNLRLSKRKLEDTFVKKWYEELWNDNRRLRENKPGTDRTFKINFGCEDYLSVVKTRKHRVALSKLRMSCNSLRIETGRYERPLIPLDQRICFNCEVDIIDDEVHFITNCRITCHRYLVRCCF